MESSKLKNIVLTILIITNVLLLGLMLFQRMESRQYRQKALEDAVELLEERGISVQTQELPDRDFPAAAVVERDQAREQQVFTRLLGEDTTLTRRGLVSLYDGSLGQAEVREDGTFSVELIPGAYPAGEGEALADHAQRFLEQSLSFPGNATFVQDHAVTVTQVWNGTRVFSCQAALRYENGSLVSIAGTRLTGTPAADAQSPAPLSTATLLVRFRAGLIESGDACTAILSANQGYVTSVDAAGKVRLTPVLRLETDTNLYIINALTGEMERA